MAGKKMLKRVLTRGMKEVLKGKNMSKSAVKKTKKVLQKMLKKILKGKMPTNEKDCKAKESKLAKQTIQKNSKSKAAMKIKLQKQQKILKRLTQTEKYIQHLKGMGSGRKAVKMVASLEKAHDKKMAQTLKAAMSVEARKEKRVKRAAENAVKKVTAEEATRARKEKTKKTEEKQT